MNYKKNLSNILPINHDIRVIYKSNYLKIENFHTLKDIKDNLIIIDNIIIKGDILKINSLEDRGLEIIGKIKEIIFD